MDTREITESSSNLWQISATDKLGLALSGGGFRASLFHIGVLARMAELDLLRHVSVLSTVSGGSVIGAYYHLKVKDLLEGRGHRRNPNAPPSRQAYINIVEEIEEDFLRAVQTNLRMQLLLDPLKNARMLLSDDYSRSDRMAELYNEHFFQPLTKNRDVQNITLGQLKIIPKDITEKEKINFDVDKYNKNQKDGHKIPILTINATSLNTGHRWQFTGSWVGESALPDRSIDTIVTLQRLRFDDPNLTQKQKDKLAHLTLSDAVAASAGVPGLFTPLSIHDLYCNSRGEEIVVELVDGGVFDNQGLDALFSANCTHIICSDASGQLEDSRTPSSQIFPVVSRANAVLMTRVRAECLEKLCTKYPNGQSEFFHLRNEFQGNTAYPHIPGPVDNSDNKTNGHIYRLANLRTDLDSFTDMEAYTLMYDGYCLCDSRLATRSNALNLGTGAPKEVPSDGRWKFLEIKKIITEKRNELLEHLKVGANRSFKVFRIAPYSSLLCAAILAAPFLILSWKHFEFIKRLYVYFITYGMGFAIPIAVIFLLLKKVENAKLFMQLLDKLRQYRRGNVWYLKYPFAPIGAIGSVIALIHLCIFDPLFQKVGRV